MKHLKKLFGGLLSLAMVLLLVLPFVPLEAQAAWINYDVKIYEGMKYVENSGGASATWASLDTATNTITLKEDLDFHNEHCMVFESGSWILDLNGRTISGYPAIDILSGVSLTIIGSGTIQGNRVPAYIDYYEASICLGVLL